MALSVAVAEAHHEQVMRKPAPIAVAPLVPLRLLAYVHLRNIHASTGAGRTARQIVEHLAKRDDVQLRVLADANDRERILPLVQQPWTDYRYHTFTADTSKQQAKWLALGFPKAETFWPDAQVMYCTAESYVPVAKARLAVTLHDAAYFESGAHRETAQVRNTRLKWRFMYRRFARRADMFHTVSQFSAERLAHFFPQMASRIRWVHNGVAEQFFKPVPEAGKAFLKSAGLSERPYVLVPGGLHYRKNAELILAAVPELLKHFPDLIVAVVNHSDPVYLQQAKSLGDRFQLLGFVSDDALHALYAAAQVVWFPSRYEGFGLPVVEAMACGTPVVASNASSIPEISGTAALLVDPNQPAAHIDAIASLLTDARAHENLAAAGSLRSLQFRWSKTAAQLKGHFDALL